MAQILVRVDEDLANEVRRIVKEKYGGRRGALSLVVRLRCEKSSLLRLRFRRRLSSR